jgi:lipopolysaccharide export system protein LptA
VLAGFDNEDGTASLVLNTGATLTGAGNVLADNLKLGTGTWLVTAANATITANTITLGSASDAKFGADNGDNATVLTGNENGPNTFTASGDKITLEQSGTNNLTISGTSNDATLTTGANAGHRSNSRDNYNISYR